MPGALLSNGAARILVSSRRTLTVKGMDPARVTLNTTSATTGEGNNDPDLELHTGCGGNGSDRPALVCAGTGASGPFNSPSPFASRFSLWVAGST
jgi:hypothetical protein